MAEKIQTLTLEDLKEAEKQKRAELKVSSKKKLTAAALCLALGVFGFHRFYTGHYLTGVLQAFTFGFMGIWTVIDLLLILFGKFRDSDNALLAV